MMMDDLTAELTDAPLARSEEDYEEDQVRSEDVEEWQDFSSSQIAGASSSFSAGGGSAESTFGSSGYSSLAGTCENFRTVVGKAAKVDQHFTEGMSRGGSLEDLVGTFDEKISQCFGDMDSDLQDFAPVQIRTHDELIGQSKFWQDLTSSFGTVMPVDWSKTVIRNKLFLPVLALNCHTNSNSMDNHCSSSSDEELNNQLDMHNIICSDPDHNGLASADDVIKEIENIMQQGDGGGHVEGAEECSLGGRNDAESQANQSSSASSLPTLPSPLYEEKLQDLNSTELMELQTELERLTQKYSEILIQELALRDEQQFEKEVKNSFISELIKVQNKRRQFAIDKKRSGGGGSLKAKTPDRDAKYLTTIIPYEPGLLTTRHMQIMIKILAAINEDSPTTPALLTDYILKVLCPKDMAVI
ncbi:putative Fasciculation and elongation protein zeta-2 [Hypsibius exemplaris]|uniref:Fasciculation and elongation protein zeta-2 n=1 Tax=Hypsibius exemplaris TaxID=2072580 RepID=A0A9X6N9M4_HYPEX|nr:putative Fasciculation and elongation protein zeta-2 [Hypsibius exemplaris]